MHWHAALVQLSVHVVTVMCAMVVGYICEDYMQKDSMIPCRQVDASNDGSGCGHCVGMTLDDDLFGSCGYHTDI